jgi:hypothetical protein
MVIGLEILHYPPDGSAWRREISRMPDIAAIEAAVRRLDRDEWPYVWLHTTGPLDGAMSDNSLCIMGGRGEYNICLWKDGDEIHYLDNTRGEAPIRIWESDQGSFITEKNLCNDVSRVLQITAHFCVSGKLDPSVKWEKW